MDDESGRLCSELLNPQDGGLDMARDMEVAPRDKDGFRDESIAVRDADW